MSLLSTRFNQCMLYVGEEHVVIVHPLPYTSSMNANISGFVYWLIRLTYLCWTTYLRL